MKRIPGLRRLHVPGWPRPIVTDGTATVANPICPACHADVTAGERYAAVRVCDHCGYHFRLRARERIAMLADAGSFREIDRWLASSDPLTFADDRPYQERLADQQRRLGEADAVVAGTARFHGRPVVIAVLDFAFMGGSMGVVVGEKIVRAAQRAAKERCPLITIVGSGGARMQEGMLSLMQMAKTVTAIRQLQTRGLPYLSVLTDPTTGGVFASFASLGDIIIAEPHALIGFAGPRVVEQTIGEALPPGSHTAEFLADHGMIDAVVSRDDLASYLDRILKAAPPARARPKRPAPSRPAASVGAKLEAWQIVQAARAGDRPTALDYINGMIGDFTELHGDRLFGDDPAIVAGVGVLNELPLAVIGIERGHDAARAGRRFGRPYPEGFRKAQRVMDLAERWRLPLVTLVDTPGAYPGPAAEARGLALSIATCLARMIDLATPTVAAIVGEGGSGGALALATADRVVMQERAIYSVIAPEGAAAILYRDAGRAPEIASRLKLTAPDLQALGIVDAIAPEPPEGAAGDPTAAIAGLREAILAALAEIEHADPARLRAARMRRYQEFGREFTGGEAACDRTAAPAVTPFITHQSAGGPVSPV